ncbi:hypothetical protein R69746_07821 [Paraburkholderia aspalathi]|uniref:DGQHR domain-containing protein DpdB n=1 Tax=Paraburkholderia aspalathi TaxID=1324617 RepID=UPI00190C54E8|nr:DGQHR domain-containing protein DpdB [Paraburkholderia aspalathi]MBK3843795.1 DGQHR domain-containing protein [Paraburkholderia aspalathi]CAE6861132.1 hypothetical protein R69746_07821 [Paraburkholderia aspalathi]
MNIYRFKAIRASQAPTRDVFTFAATPGQIRGFAEIERVGREEDGQLRGFQRHQIASHIKEIRDYLRRDDALLPNSLLVAFIGGVKIKDKGDGVVGIEIKVDGCKPGFVVDGQQRLSAFVGIAKPRFQIFVTALICKDYNELRQQFVLINNIRPLPKTLIYELLPNVEGLPERFTRRKFAARIVDRLNFTRGSALYGEIRQHTNPKGILSDTAMLKVVMNSTSDGAIREFIEDGEFEDRAYKLVNAFFEAVAVVFGCEWIGTNPKTSRLRHGAGIVAMGFVMEFLYSSEGATTRADFEGGLKLLKGCTAWTGGQWRLAPYDERPWNGIQNTRSDIDLLAKYLIRSMKRALRNPQQVTNS